MEKFIKWVTDNKKVVIVVCFLIGSGFVLVSMMESG